MPVWFSVRKCSFNDNRIFFVFLLFSIACCNCLIVTAQIKSDTLLDSDTAKKAKMLYFKTQKDLIDLAYNVVNKNTDSRLINYEKKSRKVFLSIGPILEYTVTTGFTYGMAASGSYLTSDDGKTNISVILAAVKFTQKKQFLLPVQSSVWTKSNQYNFVGDWHYINFPQDTYGFGGFTSLSDGYIVTYQSIRFYEYGLRQIKKNIYAGMGYQLDYHWNIQQVNPPQGVMTDFDQYGYNKTSVSSGIGFELLFDSRQNSANPVAGGFYCNLNFLQNSSLLGSNSNWNSLLIDIRKYFPVSRHNILAFWSYNVFTLSGKPPYLDLPGTGTDTYNNTGRGYVYDRFIGKKMMDLECEFRYGITRNGLLGGVVFANAESVSELGTNKLEVISPAFGFGLRLKFNKFSNTNVCIDYAIGTNGSRGFYGNLGEVF